MHSPPLILMVDDEVHILHVLGLKLREAGFNVMPAENGHEAFSLAVAHQPDMMIVDYQMPGLNGLELCRRLHAQPRTASMPALMLTAHASSFREHDRDQTNITAVLSKPFSPREVLAHVQQTLAIQPEGCPR